MEGRMRSIFSSPTVLDLERLVLTMIKGSKKQRKEKMRRRTSVPFNEMQRRSNKREENTNNIQKWGNRN